MEVCRVERDRARGTGISGLYHAGGPAKKDLRLVEVEEGAPAARGRYQRRARPRCRRGRTHALKPAAMVGRTLYFPATYALPPQPPQPPAHGADLSCHRMVSRLRSL